MSQAGKLDVRNAGTHEAGHTLLLLDLELDENIDMTMFLNITEDGETRKRSLESGDRAGVRYIYPEFKVDITDPTENEDVSGVVTIRATVTNYTNVGTISAYWRVTGTGYDSGWVSMSGGPKYWVGSWNTWSLDEDYYDIKVKASAPDPYDLYDEDMSMS